MIATAAVTLDVAIICLYLVGVALVGAYFTRRNKSTEAYFLGDRAFPGWVVGLSMLSSSISSITFLSLPAAAFALDWRLNVKNAVLPLVAIVAILVFVPIFRQGHASTAFEYLEKRFGSAARLYTAFSFVLMQLLRIGVVLYLVSIPIELLLGVNRTLVIIVIGFAVAAYTIFGGLSAVIWTDVLQVTIFLLGGLLSLWLIARQLPGGLVQVFQDGMRADKFSIGDMRFSFTDRTFWTLAVIGIAGWLAEYSGGQATVQRYIAAKSTREARKAIIVVALTSVPLWSLFFLIGTAIWVFYQAFPEAMVNSIEADAVFPHFILTQVPPGLRGVIISAILAAALGTLAAGVNSIATASVVDGFERFLLPGRSDRAYLRLGRLTSLMTCIAMVALAYGLQFIDKESMTDLSLIIASIFGGGVLGLYVIGLCTTRVGNRAILVGLACSIGLNIYLMLNSFGWLPSGWGIRVHDYWVTVLVNVLLMVVAYVVSLFIPNRVKDLAGLTVWTRSGIKPT